MREAPVVFQQRRIKFRRGFAAAPDDAAGDAHLDATVRHTWPGAGVATVALLAVSWGLSLWVDYAANFEAFYGAFGSVVVIVLWFYFSTLALVVGGFVNAELERHAEFPES